MRVAPARAEDPDCTNISVVPAAERAVPPDAAPPQAPSVAPDVVTVTAEPDVEQPPVVRSANSRIGSRHTKKKTEKDHCTVRLLPCLRPRKQLTPLFDSLHTDRVFGIEFDQSEEGDEAMQITKKVMWISGCFFGIAVANAFRTWYDGELNKALTELFWSSLVPACGYYGAKQRDRSLLLTFWCCNVITAFVAALVLVTYTLRILQTWSNLQCCNDYQTPCNYNENLCSNRTTSHLASYYSSQGSRYRGYSSYRSRNYQQHQLQTQRILNCQCSYWRSFDDKRVSTFSDDNLYILVICYTVQFLLSSSAIVWSKRLHDHAYFDPNRRVNRRHPAVSTRIQTVQAVSVPHTVHAVPCTPVVEAQANPLAANRAQPCVVATVVACSQPAQPCDATTAASATSARAGHQ